ncbi:lytic transglycosylase domain-containing protein [Pseudemcibacter aquimaris]|uniref:lytic transglycosylase domain-containing protein n=1 Tax=Pseudemcibacter aquimaris TaxID=2857064 RepID=UPI002013AA82|nr:lytic transglycosylase domain-containing protein [Pseudemcibacter aquimaris]MCC3859678.1 lytic transglycosylase domain-containing protein [Pseudemcibacter aquimaris]WDU60073.1 lytic transglycosylase domain-containing protein [Pseudemcibacter aquimaris]
MIKKLLIILFTLNFSHVFAQDMDLSPLSADDVENYETIFYEQNRGNWKKADRAIKRVENKILMGHVYYQRYMHATAYISKYSELKEWMSNYGDHPGAQRIYDLGVRKNKGRPGGMMRPMTGKAYAFPAEKPTPPSRADIERAKIEAEKKKAAIPTEEQERKRQERRDVAELNRVIARYLRQQNPERAEKRLWAFSERGILSEREIDNHLSKIANTYFLSGRDSKALALAQIGSRSRQYISQNDWIAGLAAWRLGECSIAAEHFEHVAKSNVAGDWTAAAGGFWAARSYLACRRPAEVSRMLKIAAGFDKTFYGILAARQLGVDPNFDWSAPEFTNSDYREIDGLSSVHRAIALAQVGENTLADQELSVAMEQTRDSQHGALLGLAARLGLAATQLNIGRIETQKRIASLDSSLYPIPYITPEGGYTLDRALLFGMIRQESAFNSWAKSRVGARGLMQLMMGAAGDMSQDRRLQRIKLDDPRYNMFLGQKYMKTMMSKQFADGDLFKALSAYNAGPGNMQKWDKNINFQNDPLLYIESIPFRETRLYIERVLSNMWIYRMRMGQDIPSLDAVASGEWPKYLGQDNIQTAQNNN